MRCVLVLKYFRSNPTVWLAQRGFIFKLIVVTHHNLKILWTVKYLFERLWVTQPYAKMHNQNCKMLHSCNVTCDDDRHLTNLSVTTSLNDMTREILLGNFQRSLWLPIHSEYRYKTCYDLNNQYFSACEKSIYRSIFQWYIQLLYWYELMVKG